MSTSSRLILSEHWRKNKCRWPQTQNLRTKGTTQYLQLEIYLLLRDFMSSRDKKSKKSNTKEGKYRWCSYRIVTLGLKSLNSQGKLLRIVIESQDTWT